MPQIRTQIDKGTRDYDKEKLQERLAKLAGGVAVIRVGAPTEAAMKAKKDALDDAIAGWPGKYPGSISSRSMKMRYRARPGSIGPDVGVRPIGRGRASYTGAVS